MLCKEVGHVYVTAIFRGRRELVMERVLVDTGATFTVMPLELAREYLYETPLEATLRLGDGRTVRARVFVAEVEIEGRRGPARVMAFEGAVPVIGVDTLETLGLKVDPVTGRIEKSEYYMLFVSAKSEALARFLAAVEAAGSRVGRGELTRLLRAGREEDEAGG
jgi:predicted aspartyl protease